VALSRGRAAVAVVTREFEALATSIAANAGRPGLRVLVLPYPLDTRPEHEVRAIAASHWPELLRTAGAVP
jgi:hypothetical protein